MQKPAFSPKFFTSPAANSRQMPSSAMPPSGSGFQPKRASFGNSNTQRIDPLNPQASTTRIQDQRMSKVDFAAHKVQTKDGNWVDFGTPTWKR